MHLGCCHVTNLGHIASCSRLRCYFAASKSVQRPGMRGDHCGKSRRTENTGKHGNDGSFVPLWIARGVVPGRLVRRTTNRSWMVSTDCWGLSKGPEPHAVSCGKSQEKSQDTEHSYRYVQIAIHIRGRKGKSPQINDDKPVSVLWSNYYFKDKFLFATMFIFLV